MPSLADLRKCRYNTGSKGKIAKKKNKKNPKTTSRTSVCLEDIELRANSVCRLCAGELLIRALWNGWV